MLPRHRMVHTLTCRIWFPTLALAPMRNPSMQFDIALEPFSSGLARI
jgi:hypothetical protein